MWAATTRVTDSQVVHWLEASTTAFVETEAAGGEPGPVTPEASQVDFLDVVDGVMTVRRAGPYVTIDCLQFSLDQAQVLALSILEVVAVVRRDAAGEAVTADQASTGSRLPERPDGSWSRRWRPSRTWSSRHLRRPRSSWSSLPAVARLQRDARLRGLGAPARPRHRRHGPQPPAPVRDAGPAVVRREPPGSAGGATALLDRDHPDLHAGRRLRARGGHRRSGLTLHAGPSLALPSSLPVRIGRGRRWPPGPARSSSSSAHLDGRRATHLAALPGGGRTRLQRPGGQPTTRHAPTTARGPWCWPECRRRWAGAAGALGMGSSKARSPEGSAQWTRPGRNRSGDDPGRAASAKGPRLPRSRPFRRSQGV
jgi:hypothetical protein